MSKHKILVCPDTVSVEGDTLIIPSDWDDFWDGWDFNPSEYFTIRGSTQITLETKAHRKTWEGTLEYFDIDHGVWKVWNGEDTITSGSAHGLVLRGTGNQNFNNTRGTHVTDGTWVIGGEDLDCSGSNIDYLLDYRTVKQGGTPTYGQYGTFAYLFQDSNLVYPPLLPSVPRGYSFIGMFAGCTKLVTAPAIHFGNSTANDYCCSRMFEGCTALETIPAFIFTGQLIWAYTGAFSYMFNGCTKIKLSTTQDATYTNPYICTWKKGGTDLCDYYMFNGTGGSYTGNPTYHDLTYGTTYYTSNTIITE